MCLATHGVESGQKAASRRAGFNDVFALVLMRTVVDNGNDGGLEHLSGAGIASDGSSAGFKIDAKH